MKVVATALVLIAGAAVVLWYGNTLNSGVLGGLIGGLAALLLSIPISLTLFAYISRRHEDRLAMEAQEEVTLAQMDYQDIPMLPPPMRRGYTVDAFEVENALLAPESTMRDEEEYLRAIYSERNPPPSTQYQRPSMQDRKQALSRLPANQNGMYAPSPRPSSNMPVERGQTASGRPTTRKMTYPGFPASEPGSARSRFQSQAIRAARREAVRQNQEYQQYQEYDDEEVMPPPPLPLPRRPSTTHLREPLPNEYPPVRRSSRQFAQPPQQSEPAPNMYPKRPRRSGSEATQNASRHTLPAQGEERATRSKRQRVDPQTDYLRNNFPETGQLDDFDNNPAIPTGSLQKPLQRKAPYMYDDDPLRHELAQRFDGPPVTRRSSLFEPIPEED